ncbi:MAG: HAD-IIB family hydrolase [Deltaproteobacteria bacterium]|nr:HAD-IIB family hydrolase [Deltaproteobacteria bacterium]
MKPIETMNPEIIKNLRGFFFDIDDTFTTDGKIRPDAFSALWDLHASGLKVVPITGRPAGWCDHMARMWPIDGIIGENGAFYFWYDDREKKLKKRFLDNDDVRAGKRQRLQQVREKILAAVPGTAVASDQAYREADLAIDFREDVSPLGWNEIDRICAIFTECGGTCKISSIHVNGWFGDYDKLQMTKIFVREQWGIDLDSEKDRYIFCGDSPNDEPMFRYFPNSAGVNTVRNYSHRMKFLPPFLTTGDGGSGFAELVSFIIRHKKEE